MPRSIAALAVVMIALATAPAAGATFAPASDEIVTGPNIFVSGIGTDAQGNSLIAWEEEPAGYQAKARHLAADGALGPLLDLDPGVAGRDPEVVMTPSGRAFVVWRVDPGGSGGIDLGVSGRWVEANGALGPILPLAAGKEGELSAGGLLTAVDPAGVVTVAWVNQTGPGKLMLRRVGPDSTLGPLVPDVYGGSPPPDTVIAALPNGSTLIVFRSAFLEKVVVGPNLELGTPVPISEENNAFEPLLEVDSQGNGLVTWRRDSESTYGLRGRLLDPAGNPVGGELVIRASFPDVFDNSDLAVDSADDFLAIWWAPDAEGDNVVHARPINRLSGLGVEQTVSNPDQNSSSAIGEIDDFGSGAVAWNEVMGMSLTIPRAIQISSLGAPAAAPQELFSNASMQRSSGSPSAGAAVFLLRIFSGPTQTILARRYLVPPRCSSSSAAVVQGRPVDAPLACAGAGIEGASVVEPPKHGTVGAFKPGPKLEYVPKPGFQGSDSFTYVARNDGGASNVARVDIRVRKDTVKPRILRFRLKAGPKKKSRPPIFAYSFLLKISEPARARVTVERPTPGERKGRRCLKPSSTFEGKRCVRYVRIGKLSARGAKKNQKLTIRGKLDRRISKGGRFRATAVATDPAGNRSKPKRRVFRFKKKRVR